MKTLSLIISLLFSSSAIAETSGVSIGSGNGRSDEQYDVITLDQIDLSPERHMTVTPKMIKKRED